MKYAIMSDAHSNPHDLEVALDDAHGRGCGRFLFLGDVTGYGYDAKAALAIVRREFDVVLMGNHDSACVGLESRWEVEANPNYDIDRAQRDELSEEEVEWIRRLGYMHEESGMAFAHGDFSNPRMWNYILYPDAAVRNFLSRTERLLFCGHTHHAAVWEATEKGSFQGKLENRFRKPAISAESVSFNLKEGSRYIVNVGSVGYPRNDLCCTYAIYDDEAQRMTIRRLPFDFNRYIKDMLDNKVGLPYWLMRLLGAANG